MSRRNRETLDEYEHRRLLELFANRDARKNEVITRGELLDAIERTAGRVGEDVSFILTILADELR